MSLDSSRMNQLDCVLIYFFQLHLILHTCVRKLDVTGTVEKSWETKRCLSFIKVNGQLLLIPNCIQTELNTHC